MTKQRRKVRRGGLPARKYLSDKQIEQLLTYLHEQELKGSRRAAINEFIIILLLHSGLRAEELLSLRIEDLPCCHGKDVIEVVDGKGNVDRAVAIADWLSDRIGKFVRTYRKGSKPGSVLIPSEAGFRRVVVKKIRELKGGRQQDHLVERSCRMSYQSLYNKLRRIGEKAGIGRLHPHMLRHTYLMRLYNLQQDILLVQDQAGHNDPRTTSIYAKTANDLRRRQVQQLKFAPYL